jgi:anaerobic magnesium-protoporphyrin IX monomethyl ester cyclase
MKFLILDIYSKENFRISKDQNGGYGTANDYGNSFLANILNKFLKKNVDIPQLFIPHIIAEITKKGFVADYKKIIVDNDFDVNKLFLDDYEYIIISTSIVCHETEYRLVKELSKKKLILVGPFVTNNSNLYNDLDVKIIKGEPEFFFMGLKFEQLKDFEKFPRISMVQETDINLLSRPMWEKVIDINKTNMIFLGKGPSIYMNASRGCPYSCFHYCVYPLSQGRKVRLKDPSKLVDELEYFKNKIGIKNFIFRDPVFSINNKHTEEICEIIIERNLQIKLCIETHLSNLNDKISLKLKKAGVKLVYVGIESIDEDIKKISNRHSDIDNNQTSKVNFLEKIGIKTKCMYIIGMPEDSVKNFVKTLIYAQKLNSTFAQFSIFTPYPGTPVYKQFEDDILEKKFSKFNQWNLVFAHKNFSPKEIKKLLLKSIFAYYLRPRWIIFKLINVFR